MWQTEHVGVKRVKLGAPVMEANLQVLNVALHRVKPYHWKMVVLNFGRFGGRVLRPADDVPSVQMNHGVKVVQGSLECLLTERNKNF